MNGDDGASGIGAGEDHLEYRVAQLLNEVRNTLLGVQIILAGLLTLPFSGRFDELADVQETAYFVALASAAPASGFLIAPAQHHRVRWRHHPTQQTMQLGQVLATTGSVFLSTVVLGVAFLLSSVVYSTTFGAAFAAVLAAVVVPLWFVVPLWRRSSH